MNWTSNDIPPRSESPAFVPQPLPIRPRPKTQLARPSARSQAPSSTRIGPPTPTHTLPSPSSSESDDDDHPLLTLCAMLNVAPPPPPLTSDLPQTIELRLTTAARHPLPTHVLAIYDTPAPTFDPHTPPLLVPVSAPWLAQRLRADVLASQARQNNPQPRVPPAHARALRIPLVSLRVPHALSFPILLLPPDAIAILPPNVAALLPDTAAAARLLACDAARLETIAGTAQGAWKNALALGLQDQAALQRVQAAWNVAAEARRLTTRRTEGPSAR
ncbi:hypothetical protein K488DRAFT_86220 [Vararia minispora EC-137]|uniref:Uncharacterized protein n=1 Tax=Vararia minispora EC-137 TaxID=1314806 RepID=A0ACB8QJR4_9AGAM|nr:hypothetical protein K488DRAFT_86220 [Vararia minispora EC-137]